MGIFSDIRKMLRAGSAADQAETVESIEAALAKIASERADAKSRILGGHDRRKEMLRADASDAEIAALEQELDSQRLKLERLELVEGDLLGRLEAARTDRRQVQWKRFFARYQEAFPPYIADLRRALDSLDALLAIKEEARRSGFEFEAMAQMLAPPPLLLQRPLIASVESEFARICEAVAGRPSDPPRRPATPSSPQPPKPVQPGLSAQPPSPDQPHQPRRKRQPRRETAKEGEVLVMVLREGFEAPGGLQCGANDIIALPPDLAEGAARNGAVEFVKE